MLDLLTQPEVIAALISLIVLELILGIDNLLFISVVTNKLPEEQRAKARNIGLGLALFCLLYTSPSPRDRTRSRMPSSA